MISKFQVGTTMTPPAKAKEEDDYSNERKRKATESSTAILPSSVAKKIAKSSSSEACCKNEEGIPLDVWRHILGYLDVPQLGKCAQVSKELQNLAMMDEIWENHLRKLLRLLFDGAFYIEPKHRRVWVPDHVPIPISKRPLQSTNFYAWYREWISDEYSIKYHGEDCHRSWYVCNKTAVTGRYVGPDRIEIDIVHMSGSPEERELCPWLFQDVPLRTYYKEAGNFAYLGYKREVALNEDWSDYDDEPFMDYDGVLLGLDREMFRGLPNIRLFRGLGGYRRRYNYWYDMF